MKGKRSLIISSIITLLAIVVTLVGVSAAWFGEIRHKNAGSRQEPLYITSARPDGIAQFDTDSAKLENNLKLIPATAKKGWLLEGNTVPSGRTLRTADVANGVQTAANIVPILIPFEYSGSADIGVTDGKKAVKIQIESAYILKDGAADTSVNYIKEFFIDYDIINYDKDTQEEDEISTVDAIEDLSSDSSAIFFKNDESSKTIYMLIEPYYKFYAIKVQVSYNFVDEELNPVTIYENIQFTLKIESIERSKLIEEVEKLS